MAETTSSVPPRPRKKRRRAKALGLRELPTDSRARARRLKHPWVESVADRVEYIARLMTSGVWDETTSRMLQKALAAAWSTPDGMLAESTIRNYSAEAGRSLAEGLGERRAAMASRAARRLENLAIERARSMVPGDASAAVTANIALLRHTGFDVPEEDKGRPTTIVQVGQIVTSPVFAGLLAGQGGKPKVLDVPSPSNNAAAVGSEVAGVLPVGGGDKSLV